MDKLELRAVIKYFFLKFFSTKSIFEELQSTLADNAPSYSSVAYWCAEFKRGRTACNDDTRSGRPTTAATQENIKKIEEIVKADRRVTIRYLAEILKLSFGTIQFILTRTLKFKKVAARWVPRMLTDAQKKSRVDISKLNLAIIEEDPDSFCARFVTVDETWVHHFDPETKNQSKGWKRPSSPPIKRFKVSASAGKIMASVFWDAEGIIMIDYLSKGETINGEYYASLMKKLREELKNKRRGKLRAGVLFHHDNAPAHRSDVAGAAIRSAGFQLIQHPPYSPDLAPSDFHLFAHLKKHLRGIKFECDDEVMYAVEAFFESQDQAFFSKGINQLAKRYSKCISLKGDYVEK